ncbi:MAG: P-loop NTPase family protein [Acidiferrobacteraceae bacterium]
MSPRSSRLTAGSNKGQRFLLGPLGVGKSPLCALTVWSTEVSGARAAAICEVSANGAAQDVASRGDPQRDRFDPLIPDDLSDVWRDQAETSVLFDPIVERYGRKHPALTANPPFSVWGQVFPGRGMMLAAVDRRGSITLLSFDLNIGSYQRRSATPWHVPVQWSRKNKKDKNCLASPAKIIDVRQWGVCENRPRKPGRLHHPWMVCVTDHRVADD